MTSHLFQVDALKVYSENCVVFLLTLWVRHEESSGETEDSDDATEDSETEPWIAVNQRFTPEQLEELANNVRVGNLSISYMATILPHLEWFRGCSGMEDLPTLLLHKASGMTDLSRNWSGPAAWRLQPRSGVLPQGSQPTKLSIAIGAEEVKHVAAGKWIYGDAVYRNGFYFNCFASTETVGAVPEEKKTLVMYVRTIAKEMETALGIKWTERQGVAVRYSLITPALPRGRRCAATLVGISGMGYSDCLKRSCPTIEEVLAPYLVNGGVLKLIAEVLDVQ